jgi:hypothetical protein
LIINKYSKEEVVLGFFGFVFLAFLILFFAPVGRTDVRNLFYAGLALPALLWWLWRWRTGTMLQVFSIAPLFWLFFGFLAVWLGMHDPIFFKDAFFVFCLYLVCLMLEQGPIKPSMAYGGFAVVGMAILLYGTGVWLVEHAESGRWIRVNLWGLARGQVRGAMLLMPALVFLWLYAVEPRLRQKPVWVVWLGMAALVALSVVCGLVFGTRSAMTGFGLFFCCFIVRRRMLWAGLAIAAVALLALVFSGLHEIFIERGDSLRFAIWRDALKQLSDVCGIMYGCGRDGHLFLKQYKHVHSAYVAALYSGGVVALVLQLSMMAAVAVKAWRSRWFLVAMVGWIGIFTTSGDIFVKPDYSWLCFWIPTLMALIDSGRDKPA